MRHALDTIAPQTNGYWKQKKAITPEEIAAVLKEFDGYYAVRLIKCDGEPEYSNGGLHDGADETSFRGSFLNDCQDVLSKGLLSKAWNHKFPQEAVAYGKALLAAADVMERGKGPKRRRSRLALIRWDEKVLCGKTVATVAQLLAGGVYFAYRKATLKAKTFMSCTRIRVMIASVLFSAVLVTYGCEGGFRLPLRETAEAQRLAALAPKVVFVCDFAVSFHPSQEMVSTWKALQDPSLDSGNLVRLLESDDPKIRSLAIFALDQKNDPRVLPDVAPLRQDRAAAYSCPLPYAGPLPFDKPETWPQQPSTVGELATQVLNRYLSEAGYANFDDYWKDHKDRRYSVSWYALRLRRIWGVDQLNHPSMDDLRTEISHLPDPDRQWTILWLGTLPNPNNVVRPYSDDELIRNAQELGHEKLIGLLGSQLQSTDPDLRVRSDAGHRESLQAIQNFVLKHSPKLLAETDGGFLLQERFARSVWYAIGAAQLDRENANRILRTYYEHFDGKWDDYNRATLAIAMWSLVGKQATNFIVDWFYTASMGAGLFATPRHQFLREAEQRENTKPLIAALIGDPRFDTLDWNSLDDLARMIARWTGQHSVGSYPDVKARSDDPAVRDKALAEYRSRIRASLALSRGSNIRSSP